MEPSISSIPSINLKCWMKDLPDTIKNKPITTISLPGTHNSAAYRFNGNYMPNKVGGIHIGFLEFLRKLCPCLAGIILKDWTLNQDLNITQQLEQGIRVFDLRLSNATAFGECTGCCCGGCSKKLLLSHTFACNPLEEFLEQLKDFVDENPSEVVIVLLKPDFVHRGTLTADVWQEFLELVGTYMENVMHEKTNDIPTLKECQESGKRVFFNVQFTETPQRVPSFAWSTLRYHLTEGYLHESPSDDVVRKDILNRLFNSCCYEKKTLRNFSKTSEEFLKTYQGRESTIDVWWMDFPQPDITTKLIGFNFAET